MIGTILYRFINDESIVLRLKSIDESSKMYTFINLKTNEEESLHSDEMPNFTKLIPKGKLKIVKAFHKTNIDKSCIIVIFIENGQEFPNLVFKLQRGTVRCAYNTAGSCMDASMLSMLYNLSGSCVLTTREVSIYLDDTIESVLELIDNSIYDKLIFDMNLKYNDMMDKNCPHACPINLYGLFERYNIMKSIDGLLGIHNINVNSVKELAIGHVLDLLDVPITKYIFVPYSKSISLRSIVYDYKLLRLNDNKLYIFAYVPVEEKEEDNAVSNIKQYLDYKLAEMILENKALY